MVETQDFDKYADMTREMMKNDSWLGYDLGCIDSARKAFVKAKASMDADNHSGASWGVTANFLAKAIYNDRLVPITKKELDSIDKEYEPSEVHPLPRFSCYYGLKCFHYMGIDDFYKLVNQKGETAYTDFNRVKAHLVKDDGKSDDILKKNRDHKYMLNPLACSIVDELFPIKLPHFRDNIFRYHVTFVIKDHGNMSSDNCFVKVVGLVTPDGVSVKCNRFYHYYTYNTPEYDHVLQEITEDEFNAGNPKIDVKKLPVLDKE